MTFLALEALLIERLKELLPETVKVFSASDLAAVAANSQVSPAVHVIYGGYQVQEVKQDRRGAKLRQKWFVVPVARNVSAQISGAGARADASGVIDMCLDACMGWRPEGFMPLEIADAPAPRWIKGLGYHPLAFTTSHAVGTSQPRAN